MEADRESCPIRELQNLEAGLGLPGAPQQAIEQHDIGFADWEGAARAETTNVSASAVTIMVFILGS
jgi:hypothetical protein